MDNIITTITDGNCHYDYYNSYSKHIFSGHLGDKYIKEVIYSNPATVVIWSDGTKTVSKCSPSDEYSKETGLMCCLLKKILTNREFKNILDDWIPTQESFTPQVVRLSDVRKKHTKKR